MKSGNCAAGNRDKSEGKNLAGEDRSRAVDKTRQCRHGQRRPDSQYSQGQEKDSSELYKSAQVVAGRQ